MRIGNSYIDPAWHMTNYSSKLLKLARPSPSHIALTTHLSFIFLLSVENTAKLN